MKKLLTIFELAELKGRPVRQFRSWVEAKKIPYLKLGHRTLLFDPEKVEKALERFEIPAVKCADISKHS